MSSGRQMDPTLAGQYPRVLAASTEVLDNSMTLRFMDKAELGARCGNAEDAPNKMDLKLRESGEISD